MYWPNEVVVKPGGPCILVGSALDGWERLVLESRLSRTGSAVCKLMVCARRFAQHERVFRKGMAHTGDCLLARRDRMLDTRADIDVE